MLLKDRELITLSLKGERKRKNNNVIDSSFWPSLSINELESKIKCTLKSVYYIYGLF